MLIYENCVMMARKLAEGFYDITNEIELMFYRTYFDILTT